MDNKNTEIDLIELFIKVLLHIKKHKHIFISSLIIGLVIAYSISILSPKLYKSYITVIANENKEVFISLIESLGDECKSSNIANSLNLEDRISKKIISIEIEDNEKAEDDENSKNNSIFKIYATVTDTSIFKDVEAGLIFFAKNNQYLKKLNNINYSQRIKLINYIDVEIKKLDSLRIENLKKSNVNIYNEAGRQNEMVSLFEKKQKLERINEIPNITIVKGFNKVNSSNSFFKIALISVFLALFIGILLTIHLELRILLKNR